MVGIDVDKELCLMKMLLLLYFLLKNKVEIQSSVSQSICDEFSNFLLIPKALSLLFFAMYLLYNNSIDNSG